MVDVGRALVKLRHRTNLSACVVVVVYVIRRLWHRWRSWPRGTFILRGHWLLGTTPELVDIIRASLRHEHLDLLCGLHWQLGKTFAAKAPLQPWWLMTTCPKNIEHVMSTNFANYPKGPWIGTKLSDLLGRGICNVDGKEWYHQRKTASHMFTAKVFQEHIWSVVRRNARKLRDILQSADAQKALDIFSLMNRFALDTIGEIGFGKCIGSLEDASLPFLRSFDSAQRITFKRFFTPHWRLLKWLGIGSERETYEAFRHLDEHTRSVVRELRSCIAREDDSAKSSGVSWADIEARKSLVGLFLVDAKNQGKELSEDYLRDLVLNFVFAGRDTVTHALSWAVYSLCMHPEVAEKARKEIEEICGVRGPAYEDLTDLVYLQAVVHETLRLYPALPMECKLAADDDTWPDGTFVPQGTYAIFNTYAMGRDISLWGEDAMVFRPERWLEMKSPPTSFQYPVFHAGPRECPGKLLAQVEVKTCLAMLLPHLSFELAVPVAQIREDRKLTMGMAHGLPCYVKRVERADDTKHAESSLSSSSSTGVLSESELSDYQSSRSDYSDATSECEESEVAHAEASSAPEQKPPGRRRSGRTRQREQRRRRFRTPSPDVFDDTCARGPRTHRAWSFASAGSVYSS